MSQDELIADLRARLDASRAEVDGLVKENRMQADLIQKDSERFLKLAATRQNVLSGLERAAQIIDRRLASLVASEGFEGHKSGLRDAAKQIEAEIQTINQIAGLGAEGAKG